MNTDDVIYHITQRAYYDSLPMTEPYLPPTYTQDGFIHCTRGANLLIQVANKHFRNVPGEFVILVIDAKTLIAPLKYEMFDPSIPVPFPHIYGPINRAAIRDVMPIKRSGDGTFLALPFTETP